MKALRTHRQIDLRSLEMHRLVAAKIRSQPELLAKASAILARWQAEVTVRTLPLLNEWQRLIEAGQEDCLRVATEDSERAAQLRQSSPLSCLLTTKERNEFLKGWTFKDEEVKS